MRLRFDLTLLFGVLAVGWYLYSGAQSFNVLADHWRLFSSQQKQIASVGNILATHEIKSPRRRVSTIVVDYSITLDSASSGQALQNRLTVYHDARFFQPLMPWSSASVYQVDPGQWILATPVSFWVRPILDFLIPLVALPFALFFVFLFLAPIFWNFDLHLIDEEFAEALNKRYPDFAPTIAEIRSQNKVGAGRTWEKAFDGVDPYDAPSVKSALDRILKTIALEKKKLRRNGILTTVALPAIFFIIFFLYPYLTERYLTWYTI